jgi:hypothetical protein
MTPIGLERADLKILDAWLLIAPLEKAAEIMKVCGVLRDRPLATTLIA